MSRIIAPLPRGIKIGVSSCLLGEKVRYDGEDKLDRNIIDNLGRFFTFFPICPEVGCGLPVPRDAMRLEGNPAKPRLVVIVTREDLTVRMNDYCSFAVKELEKEDFSGFIFKKGSPSCGLKGVKIFDGDQTREIGAGIFAAAVKAQFPNIPLIDEVDLGNEDNRGNFIRQVLDCRRMKGCRAGSCRIYDRGEEEQA